MKEKGKMRFYPPYPLKVGAVVECCFIMKLQSLFMSMDSLSFMNWSMFSFLKIRLKVWHSALNMSGGYDIMKQ